MRKRVAAVLSVSICVVLVLAFALVACDTKGGDESATGGAGDAIFTEGKTAQDIKDAINSSSGCIISGVFADGNGVEAGETLYVDDNNLWVFDTLEGDFHNEMLYIYEDGVFYELYYSANGTQYAYKETAEQAMESFGVSSEEGVAGVMRYNFKFYSFSWLDALTDKDGKVTFNENGEIVPPEYIAGSGYVTLGGTTITIGYKSLVDGEEVLTEFTLSQVNNVTFAPSAEILALKAEAEWL